MTNVKKILIVHLVKMTQNILLAGQVLPNDLILSLLDVMMMEKNLLEIISHDNVSIYLVNSKVLVKRDLVTDMYLLQMELPAKLLILPYKLLIQINVSSLLDLIILSLVVMILTVKMSACEI